MVEYVEEFGAELYAKVFVVRQRIKRLVQAHVHVPVVGAPKRVLAHVAKCPYRGLSEQRSVQPRHADVAGGGGTPGAQAFGRNLPIQPCRTHVLRAVAAQVGFGLILTGEYGEGIPGDEGEDAGPLPAAQGPTLESIAIAEPREVPDIRSHCAVCMVEVGGPGLKGCLQWVAVRNAGTFAGAHISRAAVGGQGDVHGLGVGVIGKERDVLEDARRTRGRTLLHFDFESVEIGHAVVLIFQDVAEARVGTAGFRANADASRIQIDVLAKMRATKADIGGAHYGVGFDLTFHCEVPIVDRRRHPSSPGLKTEDGDRWVKGYS